MPGHMNVLLAEADIPYTDLVEMDEINPDMPQVDVALVVGANDVVNPAARTDKGSPIYGMRFIEADKARAVFAIKRSKNPGFAGIDNALVFLGPHVDAVRRREGGHRRAGEAVLRLGHALMAGRCLAFAGAVSAEQVRQRVVAFVAGVFVDGS